MARELLIIDGKCYEITNLGWNPKQCNPQVKKMCEGKDLRAQYRYVKKNSNDRTAYTSEHIAKELGLGFLEDKLFEILERDYECFSVEMDWHEEFPGNDEIEFED